MNVCIFGDIQAVHLQRIVPGLVERGVDVHVVTHKAGTIPGASVERFRVPPPSLTNPRRWRGRWERYLRGFMRRFDVVQVHFLADWGFTPEIIDCGCFSAFPWGSDVVPPPGEGVPTKTETAARIAMLRHAHAVATWGPTFASVVANFAGIDVHDIELLPLGVDLNLFHPTAPNAGSRPGELRVGCFKGFREVYGAKYLVMAMPAVSEAIPEVRFELIGDGPELANCKSLAAELGVASRVHWIPRQPHSALPTRLAQWDLSVIPSVCEAFGVAALESSAMRLPVVASDVGGLPDTVRHGETGQLVLAEAPDQLAQAIVALLLDKPLRQKMGQAGRAMVEQEYAWSAILDRWVDTYRAALDRASVMV